MKHDIKQLIESYFDDIQDNISDNLENSDIVKRLYTPKTIEDCTISEQLCEYIYNNTHIEELFQILTDYFYGYEYTPKHDYTSSYKSLLRISPKIKNLYNQLETVNKNWKYIYNPQTYILLCQNLLDLDHNISIDFVLHTDEDYFNMTIHIENTIYFHYMYKCEKLSKTSLLTHLTNIKKGLLKHCEFYFNYFNKQNTITESSFFNDIEDDLADNIVDSNISKELYRRSLSDCKNRKEMCSYFMEICQIENILKWTLTHINDINMHDFSTFNLMNNSLFVYNTKDKDQHSENRGVIITCIPKYKNSNNKRITMEVYYFCTDIEKQCTNVVLRIFFNTDSITDYDNLILDYSYTIHPNSDFKKILNIIKSNLYFFTKNIVNINESSFFDDIADDLEDNISDNKITTEAYRYSLRDCQTKEDLVNYIISTCLLKEIFEWSLDHIKDSILKYNFSTLKLSDNSLFTYKVELKNTLSRSITITCTPKTKNDIPIVVNIFYKRISLEYPRCEFICSIWFNDISNKSIIDFSGSLRIYDNVNPLLEEIKEDLLDSPELPENDIYNEILEDNHINESSFFDDVEDDISDNLVDSNIVKKMYTIKYDLCKNPEDFTEFIIYVCKINNVIDCIYAYMQKHGDIPATLKYILTEEYVDTFNNSDYQYKLSPVHNDFYFVCKGASGFIINVNPTIKKNTILIDTDRLMFYERISISLDFYDDTKSLSDLYESAKELIYNFVKQHIGDIDRSANYGKEWLI